MLFFLLVAWLEVKRGRGLFSHSNIIGWEVLEIYKQ